MFDYLIKNGTLIDGTGSPRFRADLAVSGDKIVKIGQLDDVEAAEVLDASGCIVCPGFIDNHSHADQNVLADPYGRNFLCQGITTEVGGNCGDSLSPHHGEIISIAASSMTFADEAAFRVYGSGEDPISNCVVLQEDITEGQSVTSFRINAYLPGYRTKKICVFEGKTVGHKVFCKFAAIRAWQYELEITGHDGDYVIRDMQAYYVK